MVTMAMDTYRQVQDLKAAGFSEDQAVKVVEIVTAAHTQTVTVADLKAEIGAAKHDILRWMAGMTLAQIGVIVAVVKLYPH